MKKLLLALSACVVLLTSCASTKKDDDVFVAPERTYDFVLQVMNMSSHDLDVWPEITLGSDGVPIKYEHFQLEKGAVKTLYYNSEDINRDFDEWQENQTKKYDKKSVWFICGYKQLDTNNEKWTTGPNLTYIKGYNQSLFIVDDMNTRKGSGAALLYENTENADCHYTFENNCDKPVYAANIIYSSTDGIKACSEYALVDAQSEFTFNYNIAELKNTYPDCNIGIRYMNQFDFESVPTGWLTSYDWLTDKMVLKINSLTDSNQNKKYCLTSTDSEEWKASDWSSPGDTYFTRMDGGKRVKFTEKSNKNADRVYSNYPTAKCSGFEAEVLKISGNDVGSGGYGFLFNYDLNKRSGYMLCMTTSAIFKIFQVDSGVYTPITTWTNDEGKVFYMGISGDLNHDPGITDKVVVKKAGKNIQIFFNGNLNYVIQNAKYTYGNTLIEAGHNGNADETTEIEFEYLKFQQ